MHRRKSPASPGDFFMPRLSVSSFGDQAFLFVNNYIRGYEMPARKIFASACGLPAETLWSRRANHGSGGCLFYMAHRTQGAWCDAPLCHGSTDYNGRAGARKLSLLCSAGWHSRPNSRFLLATNPGQIVHSRATRAANHGDGQVTIRPSAGTGIAFTVGSRIGKADSLCCAYARASRTTYRS